MTRRGVRGRLAIDLTAARMGGGASRARELAATMAELAPENDYVLAVSRPIAASLTELPARTRLLLVPGPVQRAPLRLVWEHLALPPKLAGADVDWILSPFNVLPLGPGGGRARQALIVSNIGPFAPEILASASRYQRIRNRLLRRLTLASIRRADIVFLLSREAEQLLGPHLHGKRVCFLPMAPPGPGLLEDASLAEAPTHLARDPFFLTAGDLLPYKGVEDAVRALVHLSGNGTTATLLVVGSPLDPDYARSLQELAHGLTPDRIVFTGSLPQPRVLALMRRAVATVVCSRVENTSRIPIEAMALGSPVIVVDRPYARDSCGDAALYYQAGDHLGLGRNMEMLLREPGRREEMAGRGTGRLAKTDWLSATRTILEALELL